MGPANPPKLLFVYVLGGSDAATVISSPHPPDVRMVDPATSAPEDRFGHVEAIGVDVLVVLLVPILGGLFMERPVVGEA